jgi:hypothetical protein
MSFAFGRPSYRRALRCVVAPNLRTCRCALRCVVAPNLRTCLALRWGAQLADVLTCLALRTCLAFVLQMCVGAPNLRTCLALRWGSQLADVSRVAFGRPSCGSAFRFVGVPNLGEAVLKCLPPSQNLFLCILQLVFFPSAPLFGRFRCE